MNGFDALRAYIRQALDDVKSGKVSHEDFVEAIESCFSEECPLLSDDWLLVRARR